MLGALLRYLRDTPPARFQPMNSNWGLVDPLAETVRDKAKKRERMADRAQADLLAWMAAEGIAGRAPTSAGAGA